MAGTSGQHLLGEGGRGGKGGPRVNILGFGSTRCSHVSPHIRVTFQLNSSPSLFLYTHTNQNTYIWRYHVHNRNNICASPDREQLVFCCYVRIVFFQACKKCTLQKITRPKLLLFQPGASGRIEKGGHSVVCGPSQLFIPPVTLHSCNHQLPSTKHRQELSGAIKPIWSTDLRMSSSADDRSRCGVRTIF